MKKVKYTMVLHSLVLLIVLLCLLAASIGSWDIASEQPVQLRFEGQYSVHGGEFRPLTESTYLNANRGDVILRGNFVQESGEKGLRSGSNLNFFQNHIGIEIYVNGTLIYDTGLAQATDPAVDADNLCGAVWHSVPLRSDIGPEDLVEVHLTNIHSFSNRDAYWDWIDQLYYASEFDFDEYQLRQTMPDWITAGALFIFAFAMLGTAMGFAVMRNPVSGKLVSLGLLCLFMGGYILFDTQMLAVISDHLLFTNVGYRVCMMLAAFELCRSMLEYLYGAKRKAAIVAISLLGAVDVFVALASLSNRLNFYDTTVFWTPVQALVSLMLIAFCIHELIRIGRKNSHMILAFLILQLTLLWELLNGVTGWLKSGQIIKPLFVALLLIYLFAAIRWAVTNQARAVEAERLEQQLTEARIATMISQIQPHFIYNTLGTIGHLCIEQPERASELVRSFSLYLRGNFSELDNKGTIRLANELEHVKHYTDIEKVRFPDMTVIFDIQVDEFFLPALSIQPLVENAIKHGLMGLESGGTVKITAYEMGADYCVRIEDDGVGFDTVLLQDPQKHIGIRNIRGRLEAMCGGTLTVESTPGVGTTATITIPKERKKKR